MKTNDSNEQPKPPTTVALQRLVRCVRIMEEDHEPEGWPAVRMRDISALANAIEAMLPALEKMKAQRDTLWSLADGAKSLVEIMKTTPIEVYNREVWKPNWLQKFKAVSDEIHCIPKAPNNH